MIDVLIKLRPTPGGFTRAESIILGRDTDPARIHTSLHPTLSEALDEATLWAKAEIEDPAAPPWTSLGRIRREVEGMGA